MFQNLVDCAIYVASVDKLTGSVLIKRAELKELHSDWFNCHLINIH